MRRILRNDTCFYGPGKIPRSSEAQGMVVLEIVLEDWNSPQISSRQAHIEHLCLELRVVNEWPPCTSGVGRYDASLVSVPVTCINFTGGQ